MIRYIISFIIFLITQSISASDISSIIDRIMENSVTLKKYRAQTDAAKAGNSVGLTLADPEIEFNYLWGSPNDVGQRKDISVTQRFDYATIFGVKRREARSRNELAELEYEQAKLLLQKEVVMILDDIAAANEAIKEEESRCNTAERLADMMKKKMEAGDGNRIELNKALLDLARHKADMTEIMMKRDVMMENVIFIQTMDEEMRKCLCGLTLDDVSEYANTLGTTTLWQLEAEKTQKEESVADAELLSARSASIPELTAGYMAELTREEKFRGITLGLSIPLWSNRGNMAKAKQQKMAVIAEREETIANMKAQRNAITSQMKHLSSVIESIETALRTSSSENLLMKALQEGEISIMDYIADRENYSELKLRLMEAKSEYIKKCAELNILSRM